MLQVLALRLEAQAGMEVEMRTALMLLVSVLPVSKVHQAVLQESLAVCSTFLGAMPTQPPLGRISTGTTLLGTIQTMVLLRPPVRPIDRQGTVVVRLILTLVAITSRGGLHVGIQTTMSSPAVGMTSIERNRKWTKYETRSRPVSRIIQCLYLYKSSDCRTWILLF